MGRFGMNLTGTINNTTLSLEGSGECDTHRGHVEGEYNLKRSDGLKRPIDGLDHWIFNCLVLTGYPSESAVTGKTKNPFQGRPYRYQREISFAGSGSGLLHLQAGVAFPVKTVLESKFTVNGNVNVPRLVSVEPTVETWVPNGTNRILGHFVMSWPAEDGSRVAAIARSNYEILGDSIEIIGTQHRWIEIEARGNLWNFSRRQRSTLFDSHLVTPN